MDPLEMRLRNVQQGDTGFGAVNNLSGSNVQMPQQIQRLIADMRARMSAGNMNQQGALQMMEDQNPAMKGLSPSALTALEALMSRKVGPSNFPGADTALSSAVDLAYNPK